MQPSLDRISNQKEAEERIIDSMRFRLRNLVRESYALQVEIDLGLERVASLEEMMKNEKQPTAR